MLSNNIDMEKGARGLRHPRNTRNRPEYTLRQARADLAIALTLLPGTPLGKYWRAPGWGQAAVSNPPGMSQ